jgi:putative toxin-antitoxin system antitoxin component (TIGR02293 family)
MATPAAVIAEITEDQVREGVSVLVVSQLARQLDLPLTSLVSWLQISPRTWARRKQAGALDLLESDRVARLTRLVARTVVVTGGVAEARTWLMLPHRALDRRTPFEVAGTEVGAEAVFNLLGRIEHGVFG